VMTGRTTCRCLGNCGPIKISSGMGLSINPVSHPIPLIPFIPLTNSTNPVRAKRESPPSPWTSRYSSCPYPLSTASPRRDSASAPWPGPGPARKSQLNKVAPRLGTMETRIMACCPPTQLAHEGDRPRRHLRQRRRDLCVWFHDADVRLGQRGERTEKCSHQRFSRRAGEAGARGWPVRHTDRRSGIG
jgi:hypothetical protein